MINSNSKTKAEKQLVKDFELAYPERVQQDVSITFDGKGGLSYRVDDGEAKQFTVAEFSEGIQTELGDKLAEYMTEVERVAMDSGFDHTKFDITLTQTLFAKGTSPADAAIELNSKATPKTATKKSAAKGKGKSDRLAEAKKKRDEAAKKAKEKAEIEAAKKIEAHKAKLAELSQELAENVTAETDSQILANQNRMDKGRVFEEMALTGKLMASLGDSSFTGKGLETYINSVAGEALGTRKLGADGSSISKGEISKMRTVYRKWIKDGNKKGTFKADGLLDVDGKELKGTFQLNTIDPEKLYATARYVTPSNLDLLASFCGTHPRSIIAKATRLFDEDKDNVQEVIATFSGIIKDAKPEDVTTMLDEHIISELDKEPSSGKGKEPTLKSIKVPVSTYNGLATLGNSLLKVLSDEQRKANIPEGTSGLQFALGLISEHVKLEALIVAMVEKEMLTKEEAALLI